MLAELDYFLTGRVGPGAFPAFLGQILSRAVAIEDLIDPDYERVREIQSTYLDSGVGFVDAAVLAVVERLGEPRLATLDRRHFTLMRPRHVEALELVPEL